MRSFFAWVAEGADTLQHAGLPAEHGERDVVVLARAVLRWDMARWLANRHNPASQEFAASFVNLVARRAALEPIAYILGEREFYGRPFLVTRDVLIPRPETELVIDRALASLSSGANGSTPTILDVGTGSGCLAVTLALECPAARVVATDISPAALEVATGNAARHDVASRIQFRHATLAAGVTHVDVIVSNPPYVAERDRAALPMEVRDHEPAEALFGGLDGLEVIRTLVPAATHALRPGGTLVMEIGAGQWPAVRDLVHTAGFAAAQVFEDLARIPRVVVAQVSEH